MATSDTKKLEISTEIIACRFRRKRMLNFQKFALISNRQMADYRLGALFDALFFQAKPKGSTQLLDSKHHR